MKLDKALELELVRPMTTMYFLNKYPIENSKLAKKVVGKLLDEWKQICKCNRYYGGDVVRNSMSYKLGYMLLEPWRWMQQLTIRYLKNIFAHVKE